MPKQQRKKANTRRNRNKHGGGQGAGWTPGGPLTPGIQSNAQVNQTYDACVSAPRPGQIAYSNTGGLPGMSGGAYTNNLTDTIAGFAQIEKIPCAPNSVNPQNQVGTHQSFVYPQVEGVTGQKGGTPQTGGVGLQAAQDMGVYEAPTARYSQAASLWTDSVGAPVLLNQPLDAKMWSKACTATAGGARIRRSRSNRKTNRKNRKNRSNRRNRSNRNRRN